MTPDLSGPILFMENREKTYFWQAVARVLLKRGIRVEWLVQNPVFEPHDAGPTHILPFPGRKDLAGGDVPIDQFPALMTDRGRQYFHAGSAHYPHYQNQIRTAIDRIAPVLVVGETTLLHEMLASEAAAETGATFLHPASGRYPSDRFFLFRGMSQDPFIGSGDAGDVKWKCALAYDIGHGSARPTYMIRPIRWVEYRRKVRWVITRWRVLWGRMRGERYNTPSIGTKFRLGLLIRRNTKRWDLIAGLPPSRREAILYPLQLQPESNIDVWGRPFSDQPALIRALLAAMPDDMSVLVKANPKLKYEMSDELLTLAETEPRVVLLPRDLPMAEAQALTTGTVTTCGTVGLEAIFGRGRCMSLRHPVIDRLFPRAAAASPEEAVRKLMHDPGAGLGNPDDGFELLTELSLQSFPGQIGDPFWLPQCLDPDNIALVADGIEAGWRHALVQRAAGRKAASA